VAEDIVSHVVRLLGLSSMFPCIAKALPHDIDAIKCVLLHFGINDERLNAIACCAKMIAEEAAMNE
jgi:hypothetical protein